MAANDDVVADLHEIVDLRPLADHGVAVCAPIDRHAGADLDIVLNDDAPDLRHFEMPPRPESEPEAVLPDMRAGMNDHPVADQRRHDRGRGADRTIAPDAHLRTNDRIGADDRAGANLRAVADHGAGVDDHASLEPRRRVNRRGRGDPGLAKDRAGPDGRGVESRHHQGHRPVGLGGDQRGAGRGRGAGVARRNERRGRTSPLERVEIAGIVEERQIARPRLIESGDVPDHAAGVGVSGERRAAPARDFGQRRRRARREKANSGQGGVPSEATAGAPASGAPA